MSSSEYPPVAPPLLAARLTRDGRTVVLEFDGLEPQEVSVVRLVGREVGRASSTTVRVWGSRRSLDIYRGRERVVVFADHAINESEAAK